MNKNESVTVIDKNTRKNTDKHYLTHRYGAITSFYSFGDFYDNNDIYVLITVWYENCKCAIKVQ